MLRKSSEPIALPLDSIPDLPRGMVLAFAACLILGGLAYVTATNSGESDAPLFGGRTLSEVDLIEIEVAFSSAGLNGWKREDGVILVPAGSRHEYLATLKDAAALPYALRSHVEQALSGGHFFESDSTGKARLLHARADDLGHKIASFDDIRWASVDYDEHDVGGFDQKLIRTASVVVVPEDGKPLPPARIRMIQEYVRGAYAGMASDDVVIIDTAGEDAYCQSEDPLSRELRQLEHETERKIIKLLGGYGDIQVTATATPAETDTASETGLSISVGVAESQFLAQWRRRFQLSRPGEQVPTPDTSDIEETKAFVADNIRAAIGPLLGVAAPEDGIKRIQVWSIPDVPPQESAASFSWQPAWPAVIRRNPVYSAAIASLLAIGLVSMTFAARLRTRSQYAAAAANEETAAQDAAEEAVSPSAESTLRDELAELVESNPELAAQIIHGWIAKAA